MAPAFEIRDRGRVLSEVELHATTERGLKREAEEIVRQRCLPDDPTFEGLVWQPMDGRGYRSSDYDRRISRESD